MRFEILALRAASIPAVLTRCAAEFLFGLAFGFVFFDDGFDFFLEEFALFFVAFFVVFGGSGVVGVAGGEGEVLGAEVFAKFFDGFAEVVFLVGVRAEGGEEGLDFGGWWRWSRSLDLMESTVESEEEEEDEKIEERDPERWRFCDAAVEGPAWDGPAWGGPAKEEGGNS